MSMYFRKMSFFIPLLLLAGGIVIGSCSRIKRARPEKVHSIVVVHSWDSIGEEKELFSKTMKQAFKDAELAVNVHHIYANMVHRTQELFAKYDWPVYADSIRKWKPDVILLNDDPIVEWLLTRETVDSIFLKTPIVFAGVNALQRDSLYKIPQMTGFEAHIDLGRNIELLMRIDKKQSLIVELDRAPFDQRLREQFNHDLKDSTRFVNNSNFYLRNFENEFLKDVYAGVAVVNFISCEDPTQNRSDDETPEMGRKRTESIYQKSGTMRHLQVKYDIFSNSLIYYSGMPQFTCIREQFNVPNKNLFLCGYFTGTETQVKDQVEYAARILHGEEARTLPIALHACDYYMDWNVMQSLSPKMAYGVYSKDFHIINAPYYLEEPIMFSVGVGLMFLVLSGLVFTIVHFLSRWKRKGQMDLVDDLLYEEKVHELMFSNTKDTLWVLKEGVFSYSQQFAEYFGLPRTSMPMGEVEKLVHPESKASFDFIKNFREQRGRKAVRLRLSPDGKRWYWAKVMYTVTEEAARTGDLYGLLINIDKKKETEEKLEQAQILASQVALKENFLANISHDLRTPLGAVTGFSTLLTTPGMVFEPGEREQYGEIIHQNTDMILKMIDSVMEKAQIETGDLEIIRKPVSVRKLVGECYNTNRIIAPAHLSFLLEMAEPDVEVSIDMTRTKQVVNNFLSNAFKFTMEGSVTLGWRYMDDGSDMIEVYVRDTGIGIEPEKQEHLFERYTKVNETDKGTGLGLNISKTIIEKQDGVIGVDSDYGMGSRFFFRLSRIVQCLLLVFCMGAGLLLPTSCMPDYDVEEKVSNVLVYHGYNKAFSSYKEFDEELLQTFNEQGINADLRHAYLDLSLPNQDTYAKHMELRDSLKNKGWKPDVILLEGDRAARDFLKWKDMGMIDEFDSIPIVFGGLHHPEWDLLRANNNMVVINDPIDYCANINLAAEMTGKNVVNIELDYFHQDSIIRTEIRKAIDRPPYVDNIDLHLECEGNGDFGRRFEDSIIVMMLSSASPERNVREGESPELGYEKLKHIYTNSWMFPALTVKRDVYSASIADKTGRPQFTAVKAGFAAGDGRFLCGYFASYRTVATDLATVASKLLKGADKAEFVGLRHEKRYYMDYKAMQILGMEYDDYKDKFTIVGAPPEKTSPIFSYITWTVIVMVFVLAIFSILLVVQSWRERTAQNLLESVKRRAESRNMALNGADSYTVRSESRIKEIISHIHSDYSSDIPLMMQSIDVEGTHKYEIYADVDGDNNFRWWQLRFIVMFDKKEGRKRVDGILINIDKTKKYEEELRLAMKLAEEARQKEDFLTTISHEIRTPLNAVVGFSDVMVNMPVESFSEEELAEYAKIIKTNNTNLTAMIEDILMFSRIESGRIRYEKEEFDAAALVQEVAAEWEDIIPDGISLQVLAVHKGITINNDRTRVKYILCQLLGNAIKFTSKGSIVLGLTYHLNSDRAEFFVLDTGCGIPKEKQELAFGLFWKDNGFIPGLGLGLHVVKKMTDGMGLKIKLESKVGFGSRFSLFADGFLKKTEE